MRILVNSREIFSELFIQLFCAAAATCYVELIVKESDNNVKIIVLDRLTELRDQHERVLQDMVMDILRALTSPDLDVRQKTLDLALDLVSSRNVTELVKFLEKEVQRSADGQGHDDNERYRQLLVRTLHSISVRFPDVAPEVRHSKLSCSFHTRKKMQRFDSNRKSVPICIPGFKIYT